jgi:hypothetical protein
MDWPGASNARGMWKLDETYMGALEITIRQKDTQALVITALPRGNSNHKIFRS